MRGTFLFIIMAPVHCMIVSSSTSYHWLNIYRRKSNTCDLRKCLFKIRLPRIRLVHLFLKLERKSVELHNCRQSRKSQKNQSCHWALNGHVIGIWNYAMLTFASSWLAHEFWTDDWRKNDLRTETTLTSICDVTILCRCIFCDASWACLLEYE